MGTPEAVDSESVLRDWLIDRLSLYLQCGRGRIEVDVPYVEYGLDSVASLSLIGDIEAEFGLSLEPTLAWDYPTVTALAGLLASRLSASLGAA
ncbi:polyketide synthase [Wenjunlia vitaminophila]|uniref:Polyketide synthase n=1 Tax=Wenjunlia vitaminophila TaxID=76728 RepID=A0A0T6LP86_WENVI|nr:acyl carrier protein [Wenjunlia vitaminophila]KRV47780.1 polyketide synthase [Wenjunlia vitaminophila]